MKYFGKLILVTVLCALMAVLVAVTGSDSKITFINHRESTVVLKETVNGTPAPAGYEEEKPVLILFSPDYAESINLCENVQEVLSYTKRSFETLDIKRTDTVSYNNYSILVLATPYAFSDSPDGPVRMFDYVEKGGRLFVPVIQDSPNNEIARVYRKMGLLDFEDYYEFHKFTFKEELLPGLKGQVFDEDSFNDAALFVRLFDEAKVYAVSELNGREQPILWSYDCGQGRVAVYNGTTLSGDFYKGIIAGCLNTLYDDIMYPVINAKCIFVDDFPSPQYESTSDVVRQEFNRSVKEFYRDIWWPDMQKIANKNNYIYTGLFISTYNNIVDPKAFSFDEPSMMQYYGNSLLRSGHEMGAHGYNHQSLAGEGDTPEDMGYNAWASEGDMEASIVKLREIAERLFPGIRLWCYVPPSNYMNSDGRKAIARALPDLRIVSGVYTNEGEEGTVYVQKFDLDSDGIAEFPRVTSGMLFSDYERLAMYSALGLHGVFSHFIHPDDIFDEERGKGQTWKGLSEGFDDILASVNKAAGDLRPLRASEAADALKAYHDVQPMIVYGENTVTGALDGFDGEVYFYLKTDKKPVSKNENCSCAPLGEKHNGPYYLVKVTAPEFTIMLED